ncbi:hypothetical protein [Planobispora longispora]|uniref:Uncharacterized protein n=1 Tax=Planobispora longispora TaxID=28887 RepID=A0A8J3W7P1_9ACTN|nr:hypothetical protein [Planobispora longispora]GIH79055.1 hypothetical protein Plo01_54840 [Planobispora longispora]
MSEPSDADIRAMMLVMIRRAGGVVEIGNAELYDAMMPEGGSSTARFTVRETSSGIRLTCTDPLGKR